MSDMPKVVNYVQVCDGVCALCGGVTKNLYCINLACPAIKGPVVSTYMSIRCACGNPVAESCVSCIEGDYQAAHPECTTCCPLPVRAAELESRMAERDAEGISRWGWVTVSSASMGALFDELKSLRTQLTEATRVAKYETDRASESDQARVRAEEALEKRQNDEGE